MPKWMTVPEFIKIIVLVVAIVGAYFALDSRVTIAENNSVQERLGYQYLQNQMGLRIQEMEGRITTRLDRIEDIVLRHKPH